MDDPIGWKWTTLNVSGLGFETMDFFLAQIKFSDLGPSIFDRELSNWALGSIKILLSASFRRQKSLNTFKSSTFLDSPWPRAILVAYKMDMPDDLKWAVCEIRCPGKVFNGLNMEIRTVFEQYFDETSKQDSFCESGRP